MYLSQAYIENNGPLLAVSFDASFETEGNPRPTIFVGGNGSGKTNFLSIVADSLFEAAAANYNNVVPAGIGMQRPWFRIVGPAVLTIGQGGGCSILKFSHHGDALFFKEKGGILNSQDIIPRLPDGLKPAADWGNNADSFKTFNIDPKKSESIFESGVYCYFPSSRSEIPHWLNQGSLQQTQFDNAPNIAKHLKKPIYVERSLEQFEQWVLGVILESRQEVMLANAGGESGQLQLVGDPSRGLAVRATALEFSNRILQIILGDSSAQFVWLSRFHGRKLGIARHGALIVPSIDALSGGQSTLLAIFGTLLRYGDNEKWMGLSQPHLIEGICIIDEIDAHMHVDLQAKALPSLVRLFPKVQFLMSSHSPLFILGMQKEFGDNGIQIVDLPSGSIIQAEDYAEFGKAFEALQQTQAFAATLKQAVQANEKILVFLEGETDPVYFRCAAELLGRQDVLENIEFEWIGAKEANSGQGFHTGKTALDKSFTFLKANPDLTKRKIVLLYDNDCNKPDEDFKNISVRSIEDNPQNTRIKVGIEHLLPESAIVDEDFDKKIDAKPNGEIVQKTSLNKMRLCKRICEEKRDPNDFQAFLSVLDKIAKFIL